MLVLMSDAAITRYYEAFGEHTRLQAPQGALEFLRSMDLFSRRLPPPPARIVDIGGGTGPYSETLGCGGYETHLLDAMPGHVEAARLRPFVSSASVGDARSLPWPDGFCDIALLMGPLYHLVERAGRLSALREARRVLKPGGVLAAAAISRFAPLLDGLRYGFIDDPSFLPILLDDLESGQHRNPTGNLNFFTTAYFHRPEDLAGEIREAGFLQVEVAAVEGPAWAMPDLDARLGDTAKRELLLDMLRRTETESSLAGASAHLLAFARRSSER